MNLENKNYEELFKLADKIGKRRYHKLTSQDFEDYRKFDEWRYINGDSACGVTEKSRQWVRDNSDRNCPVCEAEFSEYNPRSIDHKLPRSQYPWLSLDFRNLWVICLPCNQQKGERHWFEYEHYLLKNYPDRLESIQIYRPLKLLKSLKE